MQSSMHVDAGTAVEPEPHIAAGMSMGAGREVLLATVATLGTTTIKGRINLVRVLTAAGLLWDSFQMFLCIEITARRCRYMVLRWP